MLFHQNAVFQKIDISKIDVHFSRRLTLSASCVFSKLEKIWRKPMTVKRKMTRIRTKKNEFRCEKKLETQAGWLRKEFVLLGLLFAITIEFPAVSIEICNWLFAVGCAIAIGICIIRSHFISNIV